MLLYIMLTVQLSTTVWYRNNNVDMQLNFGILRRKMKLKKRSDIRGKFFISKKNVVEKFVLQQTACYHF